MCVCVSKGIHLDRKIRVTSSSTFHSVNAAMQCTTAGLKVPFFFLSVRIPYFALNYYIMMKKL